MHFSLRRRRGKKPSPAVSAISQRIHGKIDRDTSSGGQDRMGRSHTQRCMDLFFLTLAYVSFALGLPDAWELCQSSEHETSGVGTQVRIFVDDWSA